MEVLQNVGWPLQISVFTDSTNQGHTAEVNREDRRGDVGRAWSQPAALVADQCAMNALKAMSTNGPWITLFSVIAESDYLSLPKWFGGKRPSGEVLCVAACLLDSAQNTILSIVLQVP